MTGQNYNTFFHKITNGQESCFLFGCSTCFQTKSIIQTCEIITFLRLGSPCMQASPQRAGCVCPPSPQWAALVCPKRAGLLKQASAGPLSLWGRQPPVDLEVGPGKGRIARLIKCSNLSSILWAKIRILVRKKCCVELMKILQSQFSQK